MSNIVQLPTSKEVEQAKETSRTLAKYASQERVKMTITSENGENEDIILPGAAVDLLLKILTTTSQGKAINLRPINSVLTTQEAANMINISRPHLVKLLENGEIDFHKVGAHRRIYLTDLMAYAEKNKKARNEAMDKLASLGQELNLD